MLTISDLFCRIQNKTLTNEELGKYEKSILAACNDNGRTALMMAARYHPEVVPLIITALGDQAATNAALQNRNGETALTLAVQYHPEVVPLIITALGDQAATNAAAALQNRDGQTALTLAKRHNREVVCILLEIPGVVNSWSNWLVSFCDSSLSPRYSPNCTPTIFQKLASSNTTQISEFSDKQRKQYNNFIRNMFDVLQCCTLFPVFTPMLLEIITQNPSELTRLLNYPISVKLFRDLFKDTYKSLEHVKDPDHMIRIVRGTLEVKKTARLLFSLVRTDQKSVSTSAGSVDASLNSINLSDLPDEMLCLIAAKSGEDGLKASRDEQDHYLRTAQNHFISRLELARR